MKRITIFIIVLAAAYSSSAVSKDKIISNIEKNYRKMEFFKADFTQIQYWELADEESKISGKIYMKSDDSFKAEMNDGSYVMSDGNTVWRYSAENSQVLIEDIKDNEDAMLPGKIFFDFTEKYEVDDYYENESDGERIYIVHLISPKDTQRFIHKLKVKVNSRFYPFEIRYFDLDDNSTTLVLENISVDKEIDPSVFLFSAEEGTEIIDLREQE
ncbi:MAG: outer membrane lipoprotein carrier protein LolA [Candidatus Delongbacteria bacterium]